MTRVMSGGPPWPPPPPAPPPPGPKRGASLLSLSRTQVPLRLTPEAITASENAMAATVMNKFRFFIDSLLVGADPKPAPRLCLETVQMGRHRSRPTHA